MDGLSFGDWAVFALMESRKFANSFSLLVTQHVWIVELGVIPTCGQKTPSSLLDGESFHGRAREIWTAIDLRVLCHLSSIWI